ncbi:hypothetical protein BC938DRAFT_473056, partial [Jimgerdemannia flammicorona]
MSTVDTPPPRPPLDSLVQRSAKRTRDMFLLSYNQAVMDEQSRCLTTKILDEYGDARSLPALVVAQQQQQAAAAKAAKAATGEMGPPAANVDAVSSTSDTSMDTDSAVQRLIENLPSST